MSSLKSAFIMFRDEESLRFSKFDKVENGPYGMAFFVNGEQYFIPYNNVIYIKIFDE